MLKEPRETISKQISTISSSKETFESSKIEYGDSLEISGYEEGLVYENSSVDKNIQNK